MTEPASREPTHHDRVTVIAGKYAGLDATVAGITASSNERFLLLAFRDGRKKDLVPASLCRLIADD